jgi:hypothetical protein
LIDRGRLEQRALGVDERGLDGRPGAARLAAVAQHARARRARRRRERRGRRLLGGCAQLGEGLAAVRRGLEGLEEAQLHAQPTRAARRLERGARLRVVATINDDQGRPGQHFEFCGSRF